MAKRISVRTWLIRAGALGSVMALALWVLSAKYQFRFANWRYFGCEALFGTATVYLTPYGAEGDVPSDWAFAVEPCDDWYLEWWFWYVQTYYAEITVWFPLWLLVLMLAVPTAILHWRGRRAPLPGCCSNCGYDLTGNVSGRCPECGTEIGFG